MKTGASTWRPPTCTLTTSSRFRPCCAAVAGLISRALSQLSLLNGRGSSISQALLAKLPSQTEESGWRTTSRPPAAGLADAVPAAGAFGENCLAGGAVPSSNPLLSEVSQYVSKLD